MTYMLLRKPVIVVKLPAKDTAATILYCAENATQCAWMQPNFSGNGYINDYATGRLLLDAKLYTD